jgi:uncharacterized protein YacL
MDYSPLYVTDTSLWIDLNCGDLLNEAFQLPWQLIAPDVIIGELQEPDGSELISRGLGNRELSGGQVTEVFALAVRYRGPSRNDLFALVLAKALNATLLTSDGPLRKAAGQETVSVHGTLWVLDEMIRHHVVTPARAAEALEKMLDSGRRLPKQEASARLKVWT